MIEKAGEIIAIDQVFHNGSLSGNGREDSPLGVTFSAGSWISLSSSNKTINWKKIDGNGIKYNTERPVLMSNSVYDINTTVVINNTQGVPDYNEYALIIGGQPFTFNHDMSNPVSSVYTFDIIYKALDTQKLDTVLSAKNKDYAKYTIYQNIHDIVSVSSDDNIWSNIVVDEPITGNGSKETPLGLASNWVNSINTLLSAVPIWSKQLSELTAQSASWNDIAEKVNASANTWNTAVTDYSAQKDIWNTQISNILTSADSWNTLPAIPTGLTGNLVINNNMWKPLSALENVVYGEGISAKTDGVSAELGAYVNTVIDDQGILTFTNSKLNIV